MRAYLTVLFFALLIGCRNSEEPNPEFQVCDSLPIDSLNRDSVFLSYGQVNLLNGENERRSYTYCDQSLVDSFPNYKYAIADALIYEKPLDEKVFTRIELTSYEVIEHCQTIPDSSAIDLPLFGSWQISYITFDGDTLLPPCEINNQSLSLDSSSIGGGQGGCEAIFYDDWYGTTDQCVFILQFPENDDIGEFYNAQYRLFVDVDSVNFEIRKNFLLLNNSKNGTSAVLYRKE
ncbi:MAG: hypothetical protein RIA69_12985 [Cyclobacteriaceae bacterium]